MNDKDMEEMYSDLMKLRKGGADVELLLGLMRERGLCQHESSLVLAKVASLEFGEAKRIVIESKTWADSLEATVELQRRAMEAWRELADEDDPNFKIEVEPDSDPPKS